MLIPLGAGAPRVIAGQRIGQRVEALEIAQLVELGGAEVDAHVVVVEIGGQYAAVAGEYLAAQGLHGDGVVEAHAALGVPGVGVYHGGVDEHDHAQARYKKQQRRYQGISGADMAAAGAGLRCALAAGEQAEDEVRDFHGRGRYGMAGAPVCAGPDGGCRRAAAWSARRWPTCTGHARAVSRCGPPRGGG